MTDQQFQQLLMALTHALKETAQQQSTSQAPEPARTFNVLAGRIAVFSYDPDADLTYEAWHQRHQDIFTVDAHTLDEPTRKRNSIQTTIEVVPNSVLVLRSDALRQTLPVSKTQMPRLPQASWIHSQVSILHSQPQSTLATTAQALTGLRRNYKRLPRSLQRRPRTLQIFKSDSALREGCGTSFPPETTSAVCSSSSSGKGVRTARSKWSVLKGQLFGMGCANSYRAEVEWIAENLRRLFNGPKRCPGPPSISTTSLRGHLRETYRWTILLSYRFCCAYLQVEMDQHSKQLLTMNTHRGLYQYNRLPFGVKSAPAIFQQIMDVTFAGLQGVVGYLDDVMTH
ncbi:hypothetical protein TELCIR_06443 [Teladorsagia circumcincta]|uniref:Reverse transcriptase domain-containing protein n=1 Tax=Teladorsagia circumcincta TaxID=45464 RepID=A0A2G9UNB8_TELCI|nr:hypothetical protein TELCIR_06443 [Teladorsagia circumcincta]